MRSRVGLRGDGSEPANGGWHAPTQLVAALLAAVMGCDRAQPPPGPSVDSTPAVSVPAPPLRLPPVPSAAAVLPSPTGDEFGARVASIAMRTWIYSEPDDRSAKLGYLRAGAVVDRASDPVGHEGCSGGWYPIRPRGYVCVGKGASLELDQPIMAAAARPPRRGQPLPYDYVIAGDPPPHLYFRLPTVGEQERAEGRAGARARALGLSAAARERLGPPDELPKFLLAGGTLEKPYGAERQLHISAHSGRANRDAAFGLLTTYEWTNRRWGLTTELDLLPLDCTKIVRPSAVRGVGVEGEGTPAIVMQHGLQTYRPNDAGSLRPAGDAPFRSGWVLTGKRSTVPNGLVETTTGDWLPVTGLKVAALREDPAGFAREGRRWIDVSIREQLLVAYEGTRPVFAALVSTGRGGIGDPEKTHSTVRGTFMIHTKHLTATMDGDSTTDEQYELRDVPYVQYFREGYALHGAFWHDEFGKVRSHGCINLAPADAAWLFEWTYPSVPEGWHGAVNLNAGTLVWVHV